MKRWTAVLVALSFLTVAGQAHGDFVPLPFSTATLGDWRSQALEQGHGFAFVVVNNQMVNLSDRIAPPEGAKLSHLSADVTVGGATISLNATFNPDPFISFGAVTTNLGTATVTYTFLFGTPIVPGLYGQATGEVMVSIPDGQGALATVTSGTYPTYLSGYGSVGLAMTNLGVDLGMGTVVVPGQDFGMTSNTFAPTFYDNLEALLTYTQEGLGSTTSWSGRVTLDVGTTAVPEPSTLLLAGIGIAGLAGYGRRRRLRRRAASI